jgi:hypothetical protein
VAKKKKEDLPVFTIVEMPEWKSRVLNFMLQVLSIPGQAWVIAVEDTGFNYDGEYYEDKKTGIKIPKKMVSDEQGD